MHGGGSEGGAGGSRRRPRLGDRCQPRSGAGGQAVLEGYQQRAAVLLRRRVPQCDRDQHDHGAGVGGDMSLQYPEQLDFEAAVKTLRKRWFKLGLCWKSFHDWDFTIALALDCRRLALARPTLTPKWRQSGIGKNATTSWIISSELNCPASSVPARGRDQPRPDL